MLERGLLRIHSGENPWRWNHPILVRSGRRSPPPLLRMAGAPIYHIVPTGITRMPDQRLMVRTVLQSLVLGLTGIFVSRFSRGAGGLIPLGDLIAGLLTTVLCTMLVGTTGGPRATSGEHPGEGWAPSRGLLPGLLAGALLANAIVMPAVIPALLLAVGCILVLRWRFSHTAPAARPIVPMIARAAAIASVAFYAGGLDWLNAGTRPSSGALLFIAMAGLSMLLIEIGERTPAPERENGPAPIATPGRSLLLWAAILLFCFAAALHIGNGVWRGPIAVVPLSLILLFTMIPALRHMRTRGPATGETFEASSWAWVLCSHAAIGILPALFRALGL